MKYFLFPFPKLQLRQLTKKGRHTTTVRQMFPLPNGAVLIDSPGSGKSNSDTLQKGLRKRFPKSLMQPAVASLKTAPTGTSRAVLY
ncbi:MAG: GTPase RsgA [Euryarchaeota archaeon]|nr:GTPase RsgA [Euryarchaeota archaeon]